MIPKVRNYIDLWLPDETSNDSSSFLHSDQEKKNMVNDSVYLSELPGAPAILSHFYPGAAHGQLPLNPLIETDWDQTPTHQPQIPSGELT